MYFAWHKQDDGDFSGAKALYFAKVHPHEDKEFEIPLGSFELWEDNVLLLEIDLALDRELLAAGEKEYFDRIAVNLLDTAKSAGLTA